MRSRRLSYADARRSSDLVLDHLNGAPFLEGTSQFTPDLDGLLAAARARSFPAEHRAVLHAALSRQYAGSVADPRVHGNINALAREGTLTITTGHQLCLFGGPLYVPFKILNAVRLASELGKVSGRTVVPVFWMATEDHDRDEIDHVHVNGERIQWPGRSGGAVGRMPLEGVGPALERAIALLGPGEFASDMATLLRSAYRPEHTLAQATRLFINGLFGHLGVVCIDGDDPDLKRLFAPIMQEELINKVTHRAVTYANERLAGRYPIQAHAREINLFHLSEGRRSRIEQQGEEYVVLDGGPRFSLDALLQELEAHPERFSPNVLMRPLYQEAILPNVGYIGGGGELAYWLQLRWSFQAVQLPMPAVLLRTSAAFISAKHMRQWEKLGLTHLDLFLPIEEVLARVARDRSGVPVGIDAEQEELRAFYARLKERAVAMDPTLAGAVEARHARALHGLERIGKGFLRAAKRKEGEALERLARIHSAVFPGGGLQERSESILPVLAALGPGFLAELLHELDPLAGEFTLFEED